MTPAPGRDVQTANAAKCPGRREPGRTAPLDIAGKQSLQLRNVVFGQRAVAGDVGQCSQFVSGEGRMSHCSLHVLAYRSRSRVTRDESGSGCCIPSAPGGRLSWRCSHSLSGTITLAKQFSISGRKLLNAALQTVHEIIVNVSVTRRLKG